MIGRILVMGRNEKTGWNWKSLALRVEEWLVRWARFPHWL